MEFCEIFSGTSIAHRVRMTKTQRIISWFDGFGPDESIELDVSELDKLDGCTEKSGYWNHRDIKVMVETLKRLRGWNPPTETNHVVARQPVNRERESKGGRLS